jgi:hypothetical protein
VKQSFKGALCAAALIVASAGCNDFLKGGDLTVDPNNPVVGTSNQFFAGVQTNLWFVQTGSLARLTAIWFQQADGIDRQSAGISNGTGIVEGSFDGEFFDLYGSSGVLDLRKIQAQSITAGDSLYLGIAKVLEAWMIGTAADIWGDVPYNQADSALIYPTPVLDPQEQVYDSVQSKLTVAIAEMADGGIGPQSTDLVYNGDAGKWTELAHTLKARFFLHTAEKVGVTAYTSALAEAQQGISSNADDYLANFNGQSQFTSNPWWQLTFANGNTGRFGYLTASSSTYMYQLLNGDPRRPHFYDLNPDSAALYAGFSEQIIQANYPSPLVTYNENLLIIAESQLQISGTGPATLSLNTERAAWATATPWHPAFTLSSETGTLANIMNEKYIVLFENIEVWNDYKRTCFPNITPLVTTDGGLIPGRLLYPAGERQTNPNIPAVNDQADRNWNDPNPCTSS